MINDYVIYNLDFDASFKYTVSVLYEKNKLCSVLFDLIDFNAGKFYVLLKKNRTFDRNDIHKFSIANDLLPKQISISEFILEKSLKETNPSLVFDDQNLYWSNKPNEYLLSDFVDKYALKYDLLMDRIKLFYVLRGVDISANLIQECLSRSKGCNESLLVLSIVRFDELLDKFISVNMIHEICLNAKLLAIGAYSSHGYIFWEKK